MATELHPDKIESLGPFVEYLESLDLIANTVLFRGQSAKGNLIPGIARKFPGRNTVELERKMLKQFELRGASFLRRPDMTDLELLVLAQHHEMKTRLLDWSTNPLTALWFACSSGSQGDVYLYALNADEFQLKEIYKDDPFQHGRTLVFQPRLDNPRIVAQNGWFTLHHVGRKFVPIERQTQMKGKLAEMMVPAEARPVILSSLARMGVHAGSIYPDLVGLAHHLNDMMT